MIKILKQAKELKGSIHLTSSKSECNRVLIIHSLCEQPFSLVNLSTSKDTGTLIKILSMPWASVDSVITYDVNHAGTTMRFLTALFAATEGTRILTGSERMKQRPIAILVEALKQLGASIEYMGKEGYPPLKIAGRKLKGGKLEIDGSVSSQYISSLLLIAPTLENGLELHLKQNVTSAPYIRMTLEVMERCGIEYSWKGNVISIAQQKYVREKPYYIEGDWSGASYYYAIAAIAGDVDVVLKGLQQNSLQGDSVLASLYAAFGVRTEFIDGGIRLKKSGSVVEEFVYDFTNCPDIAQTVAVTAAALDIPAQLDGLHTLKIKETDRILALKSELEKLGVRTEATDNSLKIIPSGPLNFSNAVIETYNDHRMAMSFAPLAMIDAISIKDPNVVEKSYPAFWDDLRSLGFVIEEIYDIHSEPET